MPGPDAAPGISAESGRAMGGGGMKGGMGDQDGGTTELYKVNQVYYRMLPTLSLVAKRTLLVNAALQSQYNGSAQGITFIFNSGEYYISPTTSYLYIEAGYSDNTRYQGCKAVLSQGNILQLFDEITFTAASGTEVVREQNKGLHSSYELRYNRTQEYINTIGQLQGFSYGPYFQNQDGVAPVYQFPYQLQIRNLNAWWPQLGGTEGLVLPRTGSEARAFFGYAAHNLNKYSRRFATDGTEATNIQVTQGVQGFCVPMDQLCGMMKPYLSTLLPAGLIAGGRLELRFKPMVEALQFMAPIPRTGATNGNLNTNLIPDKDTKLIINRAYLVLDAYQLQDNVLKKLNQVAAGTDGLNILFDTYDHVSGSFSGTGVYEQMISQARSRIVRSWNVIRDNANILNAYCNSYAAEAAIMRTTMKLGPGVGKGTGFNWGNGASGAYWPGAEGFDGGVSIMAGSPAGEAKGQIIPTVAAADVGFIPWQPSLGFDTDLGADGNPGLTSDSIADADWGKLIVSSYQAVLGALYFPQQPITTLEEHIQNAYYIFGKGIPDKENTCSVTKDDFIGGLGRAVYSDANGTPRDPTLATSYGFMVLPWGMAVYGMVAEKNQALNLSGLPLSNARLLRHKFNFAFRTRSQQARVINTFTQYTRVCKVFLGGRVVIRE
jgi:hypothetical protein